MCHSVQVFDRRHVSNDVAANVTVMVKEIPYPAVTQAASVRLAGITDEDFIRVFDVAVSSMFKNADNIILSTMVFMLNVTQSYCFMF